MQPGKLWGACCHRPLIADVMVADIPEQFAAARGCKFKLQQSLLADFKFFLDRRARGPAKRIVPAYRYPVENVAVGYNGTGLNLLGDGDSGLVGDRRFAGPIVCITEYQNGPGVDIVGDDPFKRPSIIAPNFRNPAFVTGAALV